MTAGAAGKIGTPPFRLAAGGVGARVELATWGLLAAAAVFAVVATSDLTYVLRVRAALPAPDLQIVRIGQGLGTAETVLFVALLVATAVWLRLNVAAVRDLGEDPVTVLRSMPLTVLQVGAGATVVAAAILPGADLAAPEAFGARLQWMVPVLAARLALVVLLGLTTMALRRRVYAALLRSGVAPRPRRPQEKTTLLDIARLSSTIVAPLPVAGDTWWSEVAERLAAAGAALPLLERIGEERRWHEVEPGEDLTALRESLQPGTTVTLYMSRPATDDPDDPDALSAVVR